MSGYHAAIKTTHTAAIKMAFTSLDTENWPFSRTLKALEKAANECAAKYNISNDVLMEGETIVVTFYSEMRVEYVENAAHQLITWLLYRRDLRAA